MGVVSRLFRPTDVEIWRQLESEIGARFQKGDFWHRDKLEVTQGDWTVTLDTYFAAANKREYTRLRATFPGNNGFRFNVFRKGFFGDLAKFMGMQDIEIGYPEFDRNFIIQGNDATRLTALLSHDRIRELIAAQPEIQLSLSDSDNELCFAVPIVIRDLDRLKQLFELFTESLDVLCQQAIASAT
jgi:hypothetical protein